MESELTATSVLAFFLCHRTMWVIMTRAKECAHGALSSLPSKAKETFSNLVVHFIYLHVDSLFSTI